MINKKGLWFVTLFSLILVLSVYYITMPNELFLTNNNSAETNNNGTQNVNKEVTSPSEISVLKIELEEERTELKTSYEQVLNSNTSTLDEKNNAYEKLKDLNNVKGIEENLEQKIKKNLNLDAFVKATDKEISIVVEKKSHDVSLANEIMRLVQEEFKEKMSISVKFTP